MSTTLLVLLLDLLTFVPGCNESPDLKNIHTLYSGIVTVPLHCKAMFGAENM